MLRKKFSRNSEGRLEIFIVLYVYGRLDRVCIFIFNVPEFIVLHFGLITDLDDYHPIFIRHSPLLIQEWVLSRQTP